jgi:malate synthase
MAHHHGTNTERVREMAGVVDRQNKNDPNYCNMAPAFEKSVAFQAALDLVFQGKDAENGYTEPVLHGRRRQLKAQS